MILLQILKRQDHQERRAKAATQLLKLQNDLAIATSKLDKAHSDVGLVSSFVRKKGFPVEFGADYRRRGAGIEVDAEADSEVASTVPSDFGVDED